MPEHDAMRLRQQLNQETARLAWAELQRFFAQGRVLRVRGGLDLIEMAARMACDEAGALAPALESGDLARVSDEEARDWIGRDAEVWALVVKPWVLVQEA